VLIWNKIADLLLFIFIIVAGKHFISNYVYKLSIYQAYNGLISHIEAFHWFTLHSKLHVSLLSIR